MRQYKHVRFLCKMVKTFCFSSESATVHIREGLTNLGPSKFHQRASGFRSANLNAMARDIQELIAVRAPIRGMAATLRTLE